MLGTRKLFAKEDLEIERLWAIPGMTTYLLNLELVSDAMQRRKSIGALPTAEEFEFQGLNESFQITIPSLPWRQPIF